MDKQKIEDSILKKASELFAKEFLPYFGITQRVVSMEPTELIELNISRMYMDYTFLTQDDILHHFEFQSTDGGIKDLRRFKGYEAVLEHQTGKTVITHVIYSGDIKKPLSGYESGLNHYQVHIISLQDKDAAKILEKIEKKIEVEKITKAFKLANELEGEEAGQIQTMLYAFAEKFLNNQEIEPIKEVLLMTRLGQMLVEMGEEKGIEQGIERGMEQGMEQGIERGMEKGIIAFIADNIEEGVSRERIISKLEHRFSMEVKKAEEYYEKYLDKEKY